MYERQFSLTIFSRTKIFFREVLGIRHQKRGLDRRTSQNWDLDCLDHFTLHLQAED